MNERGFTLLELLVVMALIGIAATLILAAVNSSRIRAHDAIITENLSNMRSNMELYYSETATYGPSASAASAACDGVGTVFVNDPTIMRMIEEIEGSAQGNHSNPGFAEAVCAIGAFGDSWAVHIRLRSNYAQPWCSDSHGYIGPGGAAGGGTSPAFCDIP